jgi:hypothetical protein
MAVQEFDLGVHDPLVVLAAFVDVVVVAAAAEQLRLRGPLSDA